MEEEEEEGDSLTRVKMYGRTLMVIGAHMTSYVSALGRRMKENELRLLLGVQARQMKGKEGCSPSLQGWESRRTLWPQGVSAADAIFKE